MELTLTELESALTEWARILTEDVPARCEARTVLQAVTDQLTEMRMRVKRYGVAA